MILNLIVGIACVFIAILWSGKGKGYGMFSAFLALVCTVAAGGIAFAAWEPVVYGLIFPMAKDNSTFLGEFLQDTAWTLGLLGPFLVALVALRLAVDTLVPRNLQFGETANFGGGLVFGAMSAVIVMGIVVISLGFLRLPQEVFGYRPIVERQGQPVYGSSLWVPVDRITAALYEHLSRGSFATRTPLAHYQPAVHEQAGMARMTYKDKARTVMLPGDFEVQGKYIVNGALDDLRVDSFNSLTKKQEVFYPDGSTPPAGSTLQGIVVTFRSGAKEKNGNIIVTPGQVRLICTGEGGEVRVMHPIAAVAPPEAGALALFRFRFDASEIFIASVGGGSDATFGFEFLVPPGMTPSQLLIKNTRADVSELKERTFASRDERDKSVRDQSIFSGFGARVAGSAAALDTSESTTASRGSSGEFEGVEVHAHLPESWAFNAQFRGGLTLNDNNDIVDGEHRIEKDKLKTVGLDRSLRVDKFLEGRDTGIVKLTLSRAGTRTLYGRKIEAADQSLAPLLVDSKGIMYEPIGFVYDDGPMVQIRFTPGRPIRALSELPALSRAKREQTLYLIFRPTKGASITSFALGNKEIAKYPGGFTP